MFILYKGEIYLCVLAYVDDLIIVGNDILAMKISKIYGVCFHMKGLEALKYFLGMEITHNPNGIYL